MDAKSASKDNIEIYSTINPKLQQFTAPRIDNSVQRSLIFPIEALGDYNGDGVIRFTVPQATDGVYTDLQESYLVMQCKLERVDGTAIADTDRVTYCNQVMHAVFKDVTFGINGQKITSCNNLYPYVSYVHNLLKAEAVKDTIAMTYGYVEDEIGQMDNGSSNKGWIKRQEYFTKMGREMQFIGQFQLDILAGSNTFFPDKCSFEIEMVRGRREFSICMDKDAKAAEKKIDYKINITKLTYNVKRVMISPEAYIATDNVLNRDGYTIRKYFTQIDPRMSILQKGKTTYQINRLYMGETPRLILVFLIKAASFEGEQLSNPYDLQHINCDRCEIKVDGVIFPLERNDNIKWADTGKTITKADVDTTSKPYRKFLQSINFLNSTTQPGLTQFAFKSGFTIFGFDLMNSANNDNWKARTNGSVDVEFHFPKNLTEDYTAVTIAYKDRCLLLDRERNICIV